MISSAQLKIYRSLQEKKYRYKYGRFLIEGKNLCAAALENDAQLELLLISDEIADKQSIEPLKEIARSKAIPFEVVPGKVTQSLSNSVTPQGVVAVAIMPSPKIEDLLDSRPAVLLALDQIRDPGNLGTILRTAEWFGVQTVVLSKSCVDLYNSKVLRSSAGAYFLLDAVINEVDMAELLLQLSQNEYKLFAANPSTANSYLRIDFRRPLALIIGSERHGIDERIDTLPVTPIGIPRIGKGDSLNVAAAAGILLSEIFRDEGMKRGNSEVIT